MSLQLAAQHMASRGRGPDTTLVHMAPQEVAGLQALAKAHGGSLTINPDTGLPEAGFLSNLLPTLIGAGLSIASGGTLTPLMAAGITGAGYGVATGSLKKGLLAGLGAYGGAGLAGSVVGAGTGAAQQAAMAGVDSFAGTGVGSAQGINAMDALSDAATQGLSPSAVAATPSYNVMTGGFGTDPGLGLIPTPPAAAPVPPTLAAQAIPTTTQAPALTQQGLLNEAAARVTPGTELFKQAGGSYMDTAKTGISAIMDKPELLFNKENMKYGLASAAPLLFQEPEKKVRKEEKPYEYGFNYNRVDNPNAGYTGPYTGERTYFNPTFTRTAAGGGLMDIGPVEAMSNRNQAETLMANGGQMFAEGGETKAVAPVEANPYYTMTGQSGDAFKYLMGQGPKAAPATAGPKAEPPTAPVEVIAPPVLAADSASPAASKAPAELVVTPASIANATGDTANNYIFNPSTGLFTPLSTAATIARSTVPAPVSSGSGAGAAAPSAWGQMSNAEKAAYYAANPTMAAITQAGQNLFGMTALGQLAQYANPQAYNEAVTVAKGFDPSQTSFGRGAGSLFGLFGSGLEAPMSPAQMGYGSSGYGFSGPTGVTATAADVAAAAAESSDGSVSIGSDGSASSSSADSTAADNSGVGGWAHGGLAGLARGGMSHLGDYSDGGRLLRGPGNGTSDSIPATIADKRPARLADGEFVIPSRIVSELGNGSTEAGARQLYAMMDRIQKARAKTVGKNKVAVDAKARNQLPA